MSSVLSCHYDRSGCTADVDEHDMGTYNVRYLIQTDGVMGPKAIYAGAQALSALTNDIPPAIWATYSYQGDTDSYSWARRFNVTQKDEGNTTLYYLTIQYTPADDGEGSQTVGGDPIEKTANPVNRAAVMWWDREVYTQITLKDIEGKAIVNKCQDYYPDDIEIEHTRGVLVIEKNYATLGEVIDLSRTYDGTVNGSVWNIAGKTVLARCALCREVSSGPPQTEQGYVFFHVVFRFALRSGTWDEPKIETGQFHWTKKDGVYESVSIAGTTYRKHTDAGCFVPLNDDGTRRPEDQPYIVTNWKVRPEANFNALGF